MVCLLWSSLHFSFFSSFNILFDVFVSKFQRSMSTSLYVALIWTISCNHGFDWKSGLFIHTFLAKFLSFQNGLSFRCQIVLKLKIICCSFFCNYLDQSVSPSVHFLSDFQSICLFPSICPLVQSSPMATCHWWEDFESNPSQIPNNKNVCITVSDYLP